MTESPHITDVNTPIVIRPPGSFSTGWKELWRYRELLYFFTWKEIKVRYKQAVLGVLWTWLQPLAMMVVFTYVLSKGLGLSTGIIPAPLYYLSGLLFWNLFQQGVSHAAQSMVSHGHIIKKIYFPRLVIPLSAIGTATFDFVISLIIFVALVSGYSIHQPLPISIPYMFMAFGLAYLLTAFTAFSAGILLSAINVKYRDVRYILPFIIQSIFFITPVMYDTRTLDNIWAQRVLELNPLQYAIELVRASLSGNDLSVFSHFPWYLPLLLILLYFCAIYFFRKTEVYFADIV